MTVIAVPITVIAVAVGIAYVLRRRRKQRVVRPRRDALLDAARAAMDEQRRQRREEAADIEIALKRLAEVRDHPERVVRGKELTRRLKAIIK